MSPPVAMAINRSVSIPISVSSTSTQNGVLSREEHARSAVDATVFEGTPDRYQGIMVDVEKEAVLREGADFETVLEASLGKWRTDGVRGVWFRIDLGHSHCVPILVKHGFVFHHARREFVMLVQWLPTEESDQIPCYAHSLVGVGGMVVSEDDQQVLVVREKYYKHPHWKLPGGFVEPGEDLAAAAAREVLEETGVRAEFVSLLAFRHMHGAAHGCSDLYFICRLRPLSRQISMCTRELADCRWMPISEYTSHEHVHALNRRFMAQYMESRRRGVALRQEHIQLPGFNRTQTVFTISVQDEAHTESETERWPTVEQEGARVPTASNGQTPHS